MDVTMTMGEYSVLKQRSVELTKIKSSIRQIREIKKSNGTPDYYAKEGQFEIRIDNEKLHDLAEKLIMQTNENLSKLEEDEIYFDYR